MEGGREDTGQQSIGGQRQTETLSAAKPGRKAFSIKGTEGSEASKSPDNGKRGHFCWFPFDTCRNTLYPLHGAASAAAVASVHLQTPLKHAFLPCLPRQMGQKRPAQAPGSRSLSQPLGRAVALPDQPSFYLLCLDGCLPEFAVRVL